MAEVNLLRELRASVLEARKQALAAAEKRNEEVTQAALPVVIAKIKELGKSRYNLDAITGLPQPELTLAFERLTPALKDTAFVKADMERLANVMPPGFKVSYKRGHTFQCDCEERGGCTDYIIVSWSWEDPESTGTPTPTSSGAL